ncbi:hypothetical protein EMIT074MI3_11718 [Bacillus licheniformis]|jgi:hypothetical protein
MLKVDAVADSLRREGNEILHHQITEVFRGNRPGDAWLVSQRLRSAGCAFFAERVKGLSPDGKRTKKRLPKAYSRSWQAFIFSYTRSTFPDFKARADTYTFLGLPFTRMRTF